MSDRSKQWRCKNGHILGFIEWDGDDLPHLLVLREALDMDAADPSQVDAMGPLDGRMPIPCSICGDVQVWEVSAPSLVRLFRRLSKEQMLNFSRLMLEVSEKVIDITDPAVKFQVKRGA